MASGTRLSPLPSSEVRGISLTLDRIRGGCSIPALPYRTVLFSLCPGGRNVIALLALTGLLALEAEGRKALSVGIRNCDHRILNGQFRSSHLTSSRGIKQLMRVG